MKEAVCQKAKACQDLSRSRSISHKSDGATYRCGGFQPALEQCDRKWKGTSGDDEEVGKKWRGQATSARSDAWAHSYVQIPAIWGSTACSLHLAGAKLQHSWKMPGAEHTDLVIVRSPLPRSCISRGHDGPRSCNHTDSSQNIADLMPKHYALRCTWIIQSSVIRPNTIGVEPKRTIAADVGG